MYSIYENYFLTIATSCKFGLGMTLNLSTTGIYFNHNYSIEALVVCLSDSESLSAQVLGNQ